MSPNAMESDDVVFVERRHDIRIIVSIPGRYSLAERRDAHGQRRVFSCRAVNVSARAIALAAPVIGKTGERVMAHIEHLGKLEGLIMRVLGQGFVMSILASDDERDRLAAKIEWLENYKNHEAQDQRSHERMVPADPCTKMILSDGSTETCLVLDFSVSGAAVSADTVPEIGTALAIGKVVGRVVRHFVGGFGVQFIERQNPDVVESLVIRK